MAAMRVSYFIHTGAVLTYVMFHAGCFGKYLDPNYHALIGAFKEKYLKLQEYSEDFLEGVKLGLPCKIHILCVHLPEWLDDHTKVLRLSANMLNRHVKLHIRISPLPTIDSRGKSQTKIMGVIFVEVL